MGYQYYKGGGSGRYNTDDQIAKDIVEHHNQRTIWLVNLLAFKKRRHGTDRQFIRKIFNILRAKGYSITGKLVNGCRQYIIKK